VKGVAFWYSFVLENLISDEVAATPVGLLRLLLKINYLLIVELI
jgi:hypothetical protein